MRGEQVIDGTVYPDLRSATGYGNVDGLLGANCRHSFGPYRHGAPRMYDPDPKTASGLPNDEVYELTQGQRYRERKDTRGEASCAARGCSTTATRATRTWPSTLRRSRSCSGARRRCASTSAPPTRRARPGSQCCTASPTASGPATCRRAACGQRAASRKGAMERTALKEKCLRAKYPVFDRDELGRIGRATHAARKEEGRYDVVMHGSPQIALPT
ncbi:MAG: phage minor capsid protein [Adlercreutzia equolifaciens]